MILPQTKTSRIPPGLPFVIQAQASIHGMLSPLQPPETRLWSCRISSAVVRLSKRAGREVKKQGNMRVQEGEYTKEKKSEGKR